tara:strand:- start:487 stop:678 length:192 start_codon:yes stop_codon:yes gene_type:complete
MELGTGNDRGALCLYVSRRNMNVIDIIEDYSLEFNLGLAPTIFRIVREYDELKKKNIELCRAN